MFFKKTTELIYVPLCCSTERVIETKTRQRGESKSEPQYQSQQKWQSEVFGYHHHDLIQDPGKMKKQNKSKSEFKVWHMKRWGLVTQFLNGSTCCGSVTASCGPPAWPSPHWEDLLLGTPGGGTCLTPALVSADGHSAGCGVRQHPGSSKSSCHSP